MEDDFGELYADVELVGFNPFSLPEDENTQRISSSNSEEEAAGVVLEEENEDGRDSEDDFCIVLNDQDCRSIPVKKDAVVEQSERGNEVKPNYYSQPSHYKYLRPHGAGFTFNTKRSGHTSAVYFPSSLVNCDRDANGYHLLPVSSSRSTLCLESGQTGCDSSLPRHKTITDINIGSFQQKPWKRPGVDTTDYFNFGLDEESWKHYCNSLEQLWQQNNLMRKTNKTCRAGFRHQTVDGNSAEIKKGVSPLQDYAIKGEGELDVPKGRAIQVDCGTGERQPSMDRWRPRSRDSDVVIQISVQNNTKCSSSSSKEELGHSGCSKMNVFEKGMDLNQSAFSVASTNEDRRQLCENYNRDGVLCHLKRYSGGDVTSDALVVDPDSKGNAEIPDTTKECICDGSFEVIKDWKEQIPCNPSVEDSFSLVPEPLFAAQFLSSSSLLYSESHDGSSSSKENSHKPGRKSFPTSDREFPSPFTLEYCQSKEYKSNAYKTEQGDTKDYSRNESHLKEEQDSCSRVRLRSVVETTYHVGNGVVTPIFIGDDGLREKAVMNNSCKKRKRQYKNNCYDENCLPDHRETETAFNFHHNTSAGKPIGDASIAHVRAEGCTKSRTDMDTSLKRCKDDRENFVQKTSTLRENKARQGNHLLPQRNYTNRRLNGTIHGKPACFTSECSPICTGTERYRWQRKRDEKKYFRRVTEEEDIVFEHGYREEYDDESCVISVPYYERKRVYLNKNHGHVSYKSPYWRDRYGGSPSLDVIADSPCTGHSWRRPGDRSLSSHRKYDISFMRGWHDGSSLSPATYELRRLDGVHMGPWRRRHYKKHQNTGWFARAHRNHPDSDSIGCPDEYFSNDGRGNICQCEPLDWSEDEIYSKIKNHDSAYANEASFSREHHSLHGDFRIKKYMTSRCRMVVDKNKLVSDRNIKAREEARDAVVSTHIISNFDLVEKDGDEEAALKQRKSLNMQYVELEEKVSGKFFNNRGTMSVGRKQALKSSVVREHKPSQSSKNIYLGNVTEPDKSKVEISTTNRFVSKVEKVSDSDIESLLFRNDHGEVKEVILQEPTGHSISYSTHGKDVEEKEMVGGFKNRILETLAKMVKRRERFKEPIVVKELGKATNSIVTDAAVEPTESKQQQRPTRRRRWGGG